MLNGWTASGTRPEFNVVTGISTGAVIVPFAFLGSTYDDVLKRIYTQHGTSDALQFRSLLPALLGESAADAAGMKKLIETYVSDGAIQAIAKAHENGRLLLIGTTKLDAGRPEVWNIGEIAGTGSKAALKLIRDIILASASIPGVFPPVMIQYQSGGQVYDEMHVDGGVTRQVFLFPAGVA